MSRMAFLLLWLRHGMRAISRALLMRPRTTWAESTKATPIRTNKMVDELGIPTICPVCGAPFMTLRWSDEWRVLHRDHDNACVVTREQAHVMLEGRPEALI